MKGDMETTSHDDLLNEIIGEQETPERIEFENELKADILAYRFKEIRKKRKMTQTQLAEKLGMEKGQISKIENGKLNLTLATINRLASALGVKISFDFQVL